MTTVVPGPTSCTLSLEITSQSRMEGLFQLALIAQIWASAYAQFGFGGMGMGMGMGMDIRQYFGPNSFLARSIRDIVHPNAQPNQPIMDIAMRHRGPPSTRANILEYTPHFVELGFLHGVKPNGTIGQPTYQDMEFHIVEKAIKFMNISGIINPAEMANMHELLTYINTQRAASRPTVNVTATGTAPSPAVATVIAGRVAATAQTPGSVSQSRRTIQAANTNQVAGPAYTFGASPIVSVPATEQPNTFMNDYMMMQMINQGGFELGFF